MSAHSATYGQAPVRAPLNWRSLGETNLSFACETDGAVEVFATEEEADGEAFLAVWPGWMPSR
jgi:hypothetical protein